MSIRKLVLSLAAACLVTTANAQDLTVGLASEHLSMDPQFTRANTNQIIAGHVYSRLTDPGREGQTTPSLAASWENVDPLTWVVHLREGVTFHDGSPLTAEDVVYSLERAPDVPNSPASFADAVSEIAGMEIVDDMTIRFTTTQPSPLFMNNIGYVYIVSKALTEGKENADFNDGSAAIGTGAYKFVSWTPGDRIELVRNDDFWGDAPAYENVTIRFIPNDAARIAALRSGAVDLIDQVPPLDAQALRGDDQVKIYSAPSFRIIYFGLNQDALSPGLTDLDGNPLPENPLLDARVRRAVSLMIDQQAIVDRLFLGAGEAANQFINRQSFGFNPDIPEPAPDLEQAKALLTEAGYPDGFGISVYSSNDRFTGDSDLAQVLGQMLTRGGLKVNEVATLPYAVYSKAAGNNEYPTFIFSYGNATAELLRGGLATLRSRDEASGNGQLNRFNYSNPEVDTLLDAASQEFDEAKRQQMFFEVAQHVYDDTGFVPLLFQQVIWASTPDVEFDAWSDERTYAMRAKPAE